MRLILGTALWRAVIGAVVLLVVGCDPDPGVTDEQNSTKKALLSGHRKMLEILQDIKDRAPAEHQYFGQRDHIKARERLEKLAPDAGSFSRFSLLGEVGYNELLYDDIQLAIGHLLEAYQLLPDVAAEKPEAVKAASLQVKFILGVAYLRLGETQNCCLRHSSESCILPIRGDGVHTRQEGSKNAIKYFLEVLQETEGSKELELLLQCREPARWLLNIAYMTLSGYPEQVPEKYRIPPKFFESEIAFPRFENVAPKLKMNTFNAAGGAVVDDFDNDDYLDIFTSTSDPTGQTRYFRNDRDGTFTERTEEAGLAGMYGGLNMVQADYDNDGNLDVFILRGAWHEKLGRHPNSLVRNNGDGTFTDVTFVAGLGETHLPTKTAAWGDYDNDGHLDLFVANETSKTIHAPSQLFHNNGDGTFTDVTLAAGVSVPIFGMGTVWGDYNQDRFLDLFVSGSPGHKMFQNKGDGTFADVTDRLKMCCRPGRGFAVWFWDFDNDGALDLYVSSTSGTVAILSIDSVGNTTPSERAGFVAVSGRAGNLEYELPALYRGDGRGGFVDVAREQNLAYPTEPMGANFGDLNGDGYLDFYLATGDIHYWELRPNVMFLNQRGQRFVNVTMAGGFGHLQKGHGVSFVDIDNDGDQDVYVQMGGQFPGDKYNDALFENPGFGHRWITVKLVGRQSNRSAIGARIVARVVEAGKNRSIFRHVNSGGSFGCNPLRQNIGLGNADRIDRIEIYWPRTDKTQTFRDVAMDQAIQIVEGEDRFTRIKVKPFVLGGE